MRRPAAGTAALSGIDFQVSERPLRRVVTRSGTRVHRLFCSVKMSRMIPAESGIEAAFLLRAELDPTVKAIYAQAVRIEWREGDLRRSHVPDFVVVRRGQVEVHEVKPDLEATTESVETVTRQATRWFANRGASYAIALESELKAQPTLDNAEAVAYRLHDHVPDAASREAVAFVQDAGSATIRELVEAVGDGMTFGKVLALVGRCRLHLDYTGRVDLDAAVTADPMPPTGGVLLRPHHPLDGIAASSAPVHPDVHARAVRIRRHGVRSIAKGGRG